MALIRGWACGMVGVRGESKTRGWARFSRQTEGFLAWVFEGEGFHHLGSMGVGERSVLFG
ncbi:hypothetical protein QJS10_CPA09g01052 [Acorus calamus]|uniref:Uncharacterized protein n=1 Tax=Acorus calamus TaxID=4465 RepID=A0AAV9E5D9_ACOCL|nr:hypothetical protein QJS10_CPA09g01052 [Acorus calamus]